MLTTSFIEVLLLTFWHYALQVANCMQRKLNSQVVSWFVLNKPLTESKNSASTNCKYLQSWSQPSTDGTGIGASMSTSKSVCCPFAASSFLLRMLDACGWMKLDSFGLSFSDSSYISVIIYISFVLLDISPLHRELIQTKSEDKKYD